MPNQPVADPITPTLAPAVAHVPETPSAPTGRWRALRRVRPATGWSEDRGDVPGWVLVTLMTAGLVIAIWALAGPALEGVFETAIERVTSFGG